MQISKEIDKLSHSVWQRAGNEEEQVPKGIQLTRDLKIFAILVDEGTVELKKIIPKKARNRTRIKRTDNEGSP